MVLSTFRVNTTLDTVAVNFKTGKDASGHISLRSAIMAADAKGGSNKIIVPAGTFTLTIAGAGEDAGATGDLDISGNLTITGRGATNTIIDGNDMDRVIQVLAGKVSISGVTIQHGLADGEGGGILNSGGRVTLTSVTIQDNQVTGAHGLNGAAGLSIGDDGGDGGTGGAGSAAEGGGIFNAAGSLKISKCLITSNDAFGGGGGAGGSGGTGLGTGNISGTNGGSAIGGAGAPAVRGGRPGRRHLQRGGSGPHDFGHHDLA